MDRHVRILGILTGLWGALALLVGVSLLLLAMGAFAELRSSGQTGNVAAGLTTVVFAAMGGFALAWGGAHVWASTLLGRRQPAGRLLSLGLALINLLVLPFGTAFGAYALWILLTSEGRRLFEPAR